MPKKSNYYIHKARQSRAFLLICILFELIESEIIMLITHRYLKTLEKIATSKSRQQIVINQCDELDYVLNQASQQ